MITTERYAREGIGQAATREVRRPAIKGRNNASIETQTGRGVRSGDHDGETGSFSRTDMPFPILAFARRAAWTGQHNTA